MPSDKKVALFKDIEDDEIAIYAERGHVFIEPITRAQNYCFNPETTQNMINALMVLLVECNTYKPKGYGE